jgi:integrase
MISASPPSTVTASRYLSHLTLTRRGGWHRLRHTAATLLAAAGTDVATIGRILGHRPGSVVTLRYLHTDDGRLREAAEAMASAVIA